MTAIILIDVREKSRLRELVSNLLVHERMYLEVGDYVINGPSRSVCIESKSAEDYISSITSGRLNSELRNMSSTYDKNILLIHGSISLALMHRKLKRRTTIEYAAGCIVHESPLGLQSAISVVNFETIYDAALFIKTVHNLITNDDIYREPTIKKRKKSPEEAKLGTFYSLPNVGDVRSLALKNKFKSLRNLANATIEEMIEIDGIGKTIAERIYRHFNEE